MAFERKMLTVRSIALALSFLVAFECWTTAASASVRAVANETGIALFIEGDGSFEVTSRVLDMDVVMDLGWIVTFAAASNANPQVRSKPSFRAHLGARFNRPRFPV